MLGLYCLPSSPCTLFIASGSSSIFLLTTLVRLKKVHMVLCFYGRVAIMCTLWTSTNRGCKFHVFPKEVNFLKEMKSKKFKCNFPFSYFECFQMLFCMMDWSSNVYKVGFDRTRFTKKHLLVSTQKLVLKTQK